MAPRPGAPGNLSEGSPRSAMSRHLFRLDSIAFAHLLRPDPRHLAGAHWIEDRRPRRGELKRVAIAACHQHRAAAALLGAGGRSKKIVGFIAGTLGIGETAGGN